MKKKLSIFAALLFAGSAFAGEFWTGTENFIGTDNNGKQWVLSDLLAQNKIVVMEQTYYT